MGQDDESSERRLSERVTINAEFSELPGRPTYVSDLSERGVFVHTTELLPVGSVVDVSFTVLLDDPVTITARGTVVRSQNKPIGMGIEFSDLPAATILKINDVVSRRRPWDSGPPVPAGERDGDGDAPVPGALRTAELEAMPVREPSAGDRAAGERGPAGHAGSAEQQRTGEGGAASDSSSGADAVRGAKDKADQVE